MLKLVKYITVVINKQKIRFGKLLDYIEQIEEYRENTATFYTVSGVLNLLFYMLIGVMFLISLCLFMTGGLYVIFYPIM